MTHLAIQVLMYPHASKSNSFQQFSWHKPVNIRVHLRPTAGGTTVELETDAAGIATGEVPAGAGYHVLLPDLGSPAKSAFFWLSTPPAGAIVRRIRGQVLNVAGPTQRETVHVFPKARRWLVPLRLQLDPAPTGTPAGVTGVKVKLTAGGSTRSFTSLAGGSVYAAAAGGDVEVQPGQNKYAAPAQPDFVVRSNQVQDFILIGYQPRRARITIRPALRPFGLDNAVPGVTFELSRDGQEVPLREVTQGSQACVFSDLEPGPVTVRIISPKNYNGSPIKLVGNIEERSVNLTAGESVDLSKYFRFTYRNGKLRGRVKYEQGQPAPSISLIASSNGLVKKKKTGADGRYSWNLRAGMWTIMLDQSAVDKNGQTRIAEPADQVVKVQPGKTAKANFMLVSDEHGIRGHVRDSQGKPVANAIIQIRDQRMTVIDTVVADEQGAYSWKSPSSGMFVVNLLTKNGRTVRRQVVTVNSWATQDLEAIEAMDIIEELRTTGATPPGGGGVSGAPSAGPAVPEAVTDLAAYPVLTEEVSTTGVPAPAAGGAAGGGYGAGYGQAVDQAIRDVLGWRPGGDVAGFQAALTGAFQLREVEGHTEWTWQQRGYSVQADMGALTGAQASIYARAKTALDQLLPLLAGLTSLNPALFPEQDREAIRSVVTTELTELVGELALEGGPRIQRVDELFGLLLGESVGSTNLNPDVVQGQLGVVRQRFALTPDWIETVDDERVATNFRIIVEQILALQASWSTDRNLLSVVDSRTSLGTILIWLSRGLEAVCESVSDLTFALDSVYIDAAQRQVVELSFGAGQPPLLLSDLLDWIVRASHDEGPRLIQDAGRDGVRAFAPVLRRLRGLVGQTIQAVKDPALPPGLQTPRVGRALQVLHDQLREATRLAGLVHLDQAPVITTAWPSRDELTGLINVTLDGANFRRPASAVLIAGEREDIPDVLARHVTVNSTTSALATFRIPRHGPDAGRLNWQIVFINGDGTQSYPPFPIQIPIQR
jgi:hypothetical protein